MKTLSTVICLALSVLFANSAFAQSGSGTLPEVRVALPPDLASCVASCTAATGSTRPADHPSCSSVDSATSTRIETMATEIRRIRTSVSRHETTLADHERRLRSLESQIGLLSGRTANLERQVREINEAIAGIRADVATLQRQYELVVRDYVDLAVRVGVLEDKFRTLSSTVDGLNTRITSLESRMASARVGVRTGFLLLGSTDGTLYTGVPLVANLTLQFTPSTFASVSGGAVFSGGPSPVGATGRVGLGFDLHPNWAIETGASTTWVGYNSTLHASSMFLMGDVGPTFRYKWVRANASFMAGAEFDRSTSPAFGGIFTLGGEWP